MNWPEVLLYTGVGLVTVGIPFGYWKRFQKHTELALQKQKEAVDAGLTEPVSLHPAIDPNQCICSGGCTEACPEGGIIGMIGGKAELVTPSKCIGHGACEDACPVDAITLVFGTERRGVEIPYVRETFETNVPGIYIAGELGGMGLIRNAITQGREAVEYVSKSLAQAPKASDEYIDLVIVGSGPAGLAATLQAKREGLRSITLEQEDSVGGTVLSYPRQKLVMTQPMQIPLYGKFNKREIRKEELMDLWHDVVSKTGISVQCGEKVDSVETIGDCFVVKTSKGEYPTRRVLLAIGRRGTPRRLGVPGEDAPKVTYRLLEPEQYKERRLLVVGGGDSAVEAALSLAEESGTQVALSYRKDVFSRLKEANRTRIEAAFAENRVEPYLKSQVQEIRENKVTLQFDGKEVDLPNDFVFVFAGGELPTAFLQKMGVRMEKKFGTR